jgi:N-acetylglucosamine kinase
MTGQTLTPAEVTEQRSGEFAPVWQAWCDLGATLLRHMVLMHDPNVIVLGGGLCQTPGLIDDLTVQLQTKAIGNFPMPTLVLAEGGPTSGGRGAAYVAVSEAGYGS